MAKKDIEAFRSWLKGQRHRQDVVGGFADIFVDDDCAEDVCTISSLDRHLREVHGADDDVLHARDLAWREYAAACVKPVVG